MTVAKPISIDQDTNQRENNSHDWKMKQIKLFHNNLYSQIQLRFTSIHKHQKQARSGSNIFILPTRMKALVAAAAALLAHLLTAAGHRRSYHCHQLAQPSQPSHRAWSGARPALSPPTQGFPAAASYVPPLRRVTTSSGSMRLLLPFTITDTPTLLLRRSRLHQALRRGSPSSFKGDLIVAALF